MNTLQAFELDMQIAEAQGRCRVSFDVWDTERRENIVRFRRMPAEWQAQFRALVAAVARDGVTREASERLAAMGAEMNRRAYLT